MLCVSPAQCYQEQKATHRHLFFTTSAETSPCECAELWLLGKLAASLPQDAALWRFLNIWAFMCCSTLEVILSWALSTQPCIYRADRASGHAGWAPSQAFMCQPSHLRTGSFILLLRVQVVLLNLQLWNFPFWRGSWAGSIPTPALTCWGHSPDSAQSEEEMEMLEQALWHSFLAGLKVYSWDAAFLQTKEN